MMTVAKANCIAKYTSQHFPNLEILFLSYMDRYIYKMCNLAIILSLGWSKICCCHYFFGALFVLFLWYTFPGGTHFVTRDHGVQAEKFLKTYHSYCPIILYTVSELKLSQHWSKYPFLILLAKIYLDWKRHETLQQGDDDLTIQSFTRFLVLLRYCSIPPSSVLLKQKHCRCNTTNKQRKMLKSIKR